MSPRAERNGRLWVFLFSLGLAAGLQVVPFLLSTVLPDFENAALIVHAFFLFLVHPACAVLFPFILTRKYRFPAIACFFHFCVFLLFLPFYPDGKPAGAACLLLGAFSAAAGETLNQRDSRKSGRRKAG